MGRGFHHRMRCRGLFEREHLVGLRGQAFLGKKRPDLRAQVRRHGALEVLAPENQCSDTRRRQQPWFQQRQVSRRQLDDVDLIVDDTPEAVSVSTFDPVRREVARLTLERLVEDGRIHPASIEEAYQKSRDEVEQTIRDAGEWALLEVDYELPSVPPL